MSTTETESTRARWAREHGLELKAERLESRPDGLGEGYDAGASHWRLELSRAGESLETYYSMGSAIKGEPELGDVLESLALDAHVAREPEELGEDLSVATFIACQKIAQELERLLGEELLEELLYLEDEDA